MRLAIFGVGAMGCLFGARLTPHIDTTLIGHWPEQLDALRRAPLKIITAGGTESTIQLAVKSLGPSPSPQMERGEKQSELFDLALILVKSHQTTQAAQEAARVLRPDGLAISLQNGLGNYETLCEQVGSDRAAQGVTTQGAALEGVGVLKEGGSGLTIVAGGPEKMLALRGVVEVFERGGLRTDIVPAADLLPVMWGKLVINAAINPLTALLRVPNGELVERPEARALMGEAAREAAAVAAGLGIHLPYPDPAARAEEVARATASNKSSMLQDILRGARTEIEAINGAVVREGERLGIAVPVNEMLLRLVRALEKPTEQTSQG
jgi:2-dehydropantoate 2-reductase